MRCSSCLRTRRASRPRCWISSNASRRAVKVRAGLDAMPVRLRELARRASVFRYGFDMIELAVVDPEATAGELQQLEEAEIIVRDPRPGEAQQWRLRHATLKEVVYASLPKRER